MTKIIQTDRLTKYFDNLLAVDHISFDIEQGEVFGLLGPNGAGKTTTIKILTGLAKATSGSGWIDGVDVCKHPKQAQGLIGVVPDESNLYPELTGFENLCFCGALYGMTKKDRKNQAAVLLKKFNLVEAGNRKFSTYSKGMKRKLTIAAGLIHQPPMLFLDEPTTGIDVASARQIRNLIITLKESGVTTLLTTHYIEEAERLCDRIGFLVKGRLVRVDSVMNLLQPVEKNHVMKVSLSSPVDPILQLLRYEYPDLNPEPLPGNQVKIISKEPIGLGPIVQLMESHDIIVMEAVRMRPSLEDVFVQVTGLDKDAMTNSGSNQVSHR